MNASGTGAYHGLQSRKDEVLSTIAMAGQRGLFSHAGGNGPQGDGPCEGCGLEVICGLYWFDDEDEIGGNRVIREMMADYGITPAFCHVFYAEYDLHLEAKLDYAAFTKAVFNALRPGQDLDRVVDAYFANSSAGLLDAIYAANRAEIRVIQLSLTPEPALASHGMTLAA